MTYKEKIIIVAIILLLAVGLIIGPAEAQEEIPNQVPPGEIAAFVEENVIQGFELDEDTYLTYIQLVYETGSNRQNMALAIKFAECHILWATLVEWDLDTKVVTVDMLQISAARMLFAAKIYVGRAGGDPSKVDTFMIPFISEEPQQHNSGSIMSCVALDRAVLQDMELQGLAVPPPAPEDLEPKPEPKSGGIAS